MLDKKTFAFYLYLIATVVPYIIHLIFIDLYNIINTMSKLEPAMHVPDTWAFIGQIIILLFLFGIVLFSIYFGAVKKNGWKRPHKRTNKMAFLTVCTVICSLIAILFLYHFLSIIINDFPIHDDLPVSVYFGRGAIFWLLIGLIIFNSICVALLLGTQFKVISENDLGFCIILILILLMHMYGIMIILGYR